MAIAIYILLILVGAFLIIRNRGGRTLLPTVGGAMLVFMGIMLFFYWFMMNSTSEVIGIRVLEETQAKMSVEFHYFDTREEAKSFYTQEKIDEFYLIARIDGQTKSYFNLMFKNPEKKVMKIIFEADDKKSAADVFNDFFMKYEFMPVYRSPGAEAALKAKKEKK